MEQLEPPWSYSEFPLANSVRKFCAGFHCDMFDDGLAHDCDVPVPPAQTSSSNSTSPAA